MAIMRLNRPFAMLAAAVIAGAFMSQATAAPAAARKMSPRSEASFCSWSHRCRVRSTPAAAAAGSSHQLIPAAVCTASPPLAASLTTALVGASGRYPGSLSGYGDLSDFWRCMNAGIDLPRLMPLQRWDVEQYYEAPGVGRDGAMCVRLGGFLDNVDTFDPGFFRYRCAHSWRHLYGCKLRHSLVPPLADMVACTLCRPNASCIRASRLAAAEALSMDPQSRLLLEQTHLALTDAMPATGSLLDTKTGALDKIFYAGSDHLLLRC